MGSLFLFLSQYKSIALCGFTHSNQKHVKKIIYAILGVKTKQGLFLALMQVSIGLAAQNCTLSGHAMLSDEKNHEAIMIQLLDSTGIKLYKFLSTDSTGHFNFENIKSGTYKLKIAKLAYRDTLVAFRCKSGLTALNTIFINPLNLELDEITIIDKAILMKKSGDTTIFNLKAFESGSEQSATDIVSKIPGFSVSGNQFYFQDKPIEKVLIDGKDIADGNHLEFTDAINYKTIKDLRIISNYSDSFQPQSDSINKAIALDITLKKQYKNRIQGTLSANIGYKEIADLQFSIIKVGEKNAYRIVGNTSNIGKELNQVDPMEIVNSIQKEQLFNGYHRLVNLENSPEEIGIPSNNSFSLNQSQIKASIERKLNDKARLKSSIYIIKKYHNQDIQITRQYFNAIVFQEDINQQSIQHDFLLQAKNELTIDLGKKTKLEIDLPVYWKNEDDQSQEIGQFLQRIYESKNRSLETKFYFNPMYKFHKIFTNKAILSVFGINRYEHDLGRIDMKSKDSIAGPVLYDSSLLSFLSNQSQIYRNLHFNNQIQLFKKIGAIEYQYNFSIERKIETMRGTSIYSYNYPFVGNEEMSSGAIIHAIKIKYDKRPIRVIIGGVFSAVNLKRKPFEEEIETRDNVYLRPNLLFLYKLGSKWNFSTSYTANITPPSLLQSMDIQFLKSQFGLRTGKISLQEFAINEAYTFSLFREFEIGERATLFNSSISFLPKASEFYPIYGFQSFYQTQSFQLALKGQQKRLQFFFSQKFRNWNYSLRLTASQSKYSLEDVDLEDQMINSSIVFNYVILKKAKFSLGFDARISDRTNGTSKTLNTNIWPRGSVSLDKGYFHGWLGYQLIQNRIEGKISSYQIVNMEFSRKKIWKNFELNFRINDLLNLRSTKVSVTGFTPIYIQTDSYRTISGQVLGGVKWYFGA